MNTPVSFEVKQLLYDKGWRYELGVDETGYRVEHSLAEQRWNEGDLTYVDITIAEIVMWLYEKHGIWIVVETALGEDIKCLFSWYCTDDEQNTLCSDFDYTADAKYHHNSPTEAYEAAIKYTLKNLI